MQTTENLGLQYVTENEESTTKVRDYRRSTSSNFQIIDTVIAEALQKITDNEDNIKSLDEAIAELQKRGIYLCSNDETSTLEDGTNVPNIKTPDSSVIYLVSSGDAAPNMWLEYIWVNKAWEQWGSTTVDVTGLASEEYVEDYVSSSLSSYATKNFVQSTVDKNYWTGKRAMFFGTSITWYCMSGRSFETNGYTQIIADELGLFYDVDTDVIGMTGMAMADSSNGVGIYYGVSENDTSDADLVCIECTTNDFKLNVPLGEVGQIGDTGFNTSTFCGALRLAIETILERNPRGHILLITDTQRDNANYDVNYVNSAGCRMEDYVNALISIANMYGIPVCDWYHKSGINAFNLDEYTSDGLHLNAAGYERVAMLTVHTLFDLGAATPVGTSENNSYEETDPTVPAWAKSATKPSYTYSEVGAAASSHTHVASDVTSGSFSVSRGGTGRSTLTSGYFLRGNGTSAITMSSIADVQSALGIGGRKVIFGTYTGNDVSPDYSVTVPSLRTINIGATPSFVWVGMGGTPLPWDFDEFRNGSSSNKVHEKTIVRSGYAFTGYPLLFTHGEFVEEDDYDTVVEDIEVLGVTTNGFRIRNTCRDDEYDDGDSEFYECLLNLSGQTYFYLAVV